MNKKVILILFIVFALIITCIGLFFLITQNGDFYNDMEVERIIKERYGDSVVFVSKEKVYMDATEGKKYYIDMSQMETHESTLNYIVYSYKKGEIPFRAYSYNTSYRRL